MDERKTSNITCYFQAAKSTANVLTNSEQILGENIVVSMSPIEIRVPDKALSYKKKKYEKFKAYGKSL